MPAPTAKCIDAAKRRPLKTNKRQARYQDDPDDFVAGVTQGKASQVRRPGVLAFHLIQKVRQRGQFVRVANDFDQWIVFR